MSQNSSIWLLYSLLKEMVVFILQIYYYYPFSAVSDPAKLYNDLRWNLSRPQGFEAVMRVRCSQVSFI
jgi:hypothetical protein